MVPVGLSEFALRGRFADLWMRLGGRGEVEPFWQVVLQGWSEPHRRYHGLDHLRDCLARLDEGSAAGGEHDLAETALWYHDVVYRPGAPDNEARSAALARTELSEAGVPAETADEVARLVRLTDHAAPPGDPVGELVCEVDLSILGRPAAEFDEYERRIREEYRQVPDPLFRAGRAQVLAKLLAREPLFRTDHFRQRYEASARQNLRRALQALA